MKKILFAILFFPLTLLVPELCLYLVGFRVKSALIFSVLFFVFRISMLLLLGHLLNWQVYLQVAFGFGVIVQVSLSIWLVYHYYKVAAFRHSVLWVSLLTIVGLLSRLGGFYIKNETNIPRYREYRIPSKSMNPTLIPGDVVLVDLHQRSPTNGEVVVFLSPDKKISFVKRVIAKGGDELLIKQDIATVNQESERIQFLRKQDPSSDIYRSKFGNQDYDIQLNYNDPLYVRHARKNWPKTGENQIIKPEHYFMLGDNRSGSQDSRFYGPVSKKLIVGKVLGTAYHYSKTTGFDFKKIGRPIALSD